jgi:hypothetical protein
MAVIAAHAEGIQRWLDASVNHARYSVFSS